MGSHGDVESIHCRHWEHVRALPQIYKALQSAWVTDDGGFPVPADTLTEASDTACTPVAGVTTRSVYSLLMEGHLWEPSCIRGNV